MDKNLEDLIKLYSLATGEKANRDTLVRGTPLWKFSMRDGGYQRIIEWCKKEIEVKTPDLFKKTFDFEKVKSAMRLFMEGVGADLNSPHTKESPERMAKMWGILLDYSVDPSKYVKLFPADTHTPVMVKNLTFHSFCAHHGLPFYGRASISYIPNKHLIGLSKLGRILRAFSKKFQVQEKLTQEVADFLMSSGLNPLGVAIVIDSSHMCMSQRGVRMHGAETRTMVALGEYEKEELLGRFERYVNFNGGSPFQY